MSNLYFKFRRVDTFYRDMNRKDCFDVLEMNGVDENFKIVLASNCPTHIDECLDVDGTLNDNVEVLSSFGEHDGLVPMLFSEGINGECSISVNATSVSYELTDDIDYVKGLFLVSYANGSGYVIAYSINNAPLEVYDNNLILMINSVIWSVHYKGG